MENGKVEFKMFLLSFWFYFQWIDQNVLFLSSLIKLLRRSQQTFLFLLILPHHKLTLTHSIVSSNFYNKWGPFLAYAKKNYDIERVLKLIKNLHLIFHCARLKVQKILGKFVVFCVVLHNISHRDKFQNVFVVNMQSIITKLFSLSLAWWVDAQQNENNSISLSALLRSAQCEMEMEVWKIVLTTGTLIHFPAIHRTSFMKTGTRRFWFIIGRQNGIALKAVEFCLIVFVIHRQFTISIHAHLVDDDSS